MFTLKSVQADKIFFPKKIKYQEEKLQSKMENKQTDRVGRNTGEEKVQGKNEKWRRRRTKNDRQGEKRMKY